MGCFSLPCFQSDNFPKWLSDQETPLITNQISIFFHNISSFIYIELLLIDIYPIFSINILNQWQFFLCVWFIWFLNSKFITKINVKLLPSKQTLKTKLAFFLSDEFAHFFKNKNSGEIVGHNGPIYKTPLSNLYFMATVQHLKNCVQDRRKV